MFYVFICPGMPFKGDTISEGKSLGGSETACYYVAREIAARGHRVTLFTTHPQATGQHDGVDYAFCGPQTPQHPLGESAHSFLENAECDVLVVQRATGVHRNPHFAKVALIWLHDLALIRQVPQFRADSFMYDGIVAVSDWHKRQIVDTWQVSPDGIHVVRNGVDRSLYNVADGGAQIEPPKDGLNLFYQSRYERGIDYLIAPGAIMDQLAKLRPEAHLYVCGYENEPDHMRMYYDNVRQRMAQMPNVTVLGYMGKAQLAAEQQRMHAMVYPGVFEETSCISAMEAIAAGLPFVGNAVGALPETTAGGGAKLFDLKDGNPDVMELVKYLANVPQSQLEGLRERQLKVAPRLDWSHSVDTLESVVAAHFADKQSNAFSMLRSMLDRSDIVMARKFITAPESEGVQIVPELAELAEQYEFADSPETLARHYDEDHALAALDEDKNLDVTQNSRFQFVCGELRVASPSNVLDYGCQKGHYIFSCMKAGLNEGVRYTGMDVSQRHVDWANAQFAKLGLDNARFVRDDAFNWSFGDVSHEVVLPRTYDALLLCEIIEHVVDPIALCNNLSHVLIDGARVVVSTPYGDWEGKDYNTHPDSKRYHLHHFELTDLHDMFGHHDGFNIIGVPAGRSAHGALGSYVVAFNYRVGQPLAKPVDYRRKLREYSPRETVSFCAIVKDGAKTILRALSSVVDVADEFVIAVDRRTMDDTVQILERFRDQYCRFKRFEIITQAESPLDIGFDEARNRTVAAARGDWVMWMDADEELVHPERVLRYVRHNIFDGYGIAQHHMSADPPGLLTTDWPVRLFRRRPYLKFSGVVHEHPDDVERPNSGPRSPAQLTDVSIVHHGYITEDVRRARFHRNLPLIKRDRKQNPDRTLGRMLWMRDQAHMCMFGLERTGGQITPEMRDIAQQGIADWERLLANSDDPMTARMLRDGLEFYSTLVRVVGGGFEAQVQMHVAREHGQCMLEKGPRRGSWFLNREHFEKFMRACVDEQLGMVDSKYY